MRYPSSFNCQKTKLVFFPVVTEREKMDWDKMERWQAVFVCSIRVPVYRGCVEDLTCMMYRGGKN